MGCCAVDAALSLERAVSCGGGGLLWHPTLEGWWTPRGGEKTMRFYRLSGIPSPTRRTERFNTPPSGCLQWLLGCLRTVCRCQCGGLRRCSASYAPLQDGVGA